MSSQMTLTDSEIKKLIDDEMSLRNEICGIVTEGKKRSISRDLLNNSMFVEAGAGAGKTYTIVQRVLNQLCIGMNPGEIVVITFTNKAAEELRGRIARDLRDRIDDNAYEEYADRLRHALNHIDDMNISTIHSFCFKLLKERCFDAGLPVDTGLMDEDATGEQKSALFEEWMAGLKYADWDKLQKCDPNGRKRSDIKKEIRGIYNKICTTPGERRVHLEKTNVSEALKKKLFKEFETVLVDMVNDLDSDAHVSSVKEIVEFTDGLEDKKTFIGSNWAKYDIHSSVCDNSEIDYWSFFRIFLAENSTDARTVNGKKEKRSFTEYKPTEKNIFKQGKYVSSGKNKEADKDRFNGLCEEVYSFVRDNIKDINKIMNEDIVAYRNTINSYAQMAKDYYRQMASVLMLTNDALLELTRDMILSNDEAQSYFAKKYSCFYVDEFQDTDSVQESFIWRLASETSDSSKLRDGALFIVGDPKQSIYRFRGAEPDVYISVKNRMKRIQDAKGNARVYDLQINFRSNDLVIKWVNDKFSATNGFEPIMIAKGGATSYTYQPMLAKNALDKKYTTAITANGYGNEISNAAAENIIAGVYQYRHSEKNGPFYEDDDKEREEAVNNRLQEINAIEQELDMQDLSDLIINLCNNDKYKIIKKGKPEKIYYGDIMVLCQSKPNMNVYLEHMNMRGIPVQIAGSTDPKASVELNAFIRIYGYLANRKSAFDRAAAVEAFRRLNISDADDQIDKLTEAIVNHIGKDSRKMSAYGIAMYLLQNLSMFLQKGKEYTVFEMQSLQTKIIQMIESVCRNNYGTPKDIANKFYEYLETAIEHEVSLEDRTEEKEYTANKTGAVRFMNVHKSKGLEGNIVIVVDRHGEKPTADFVLSDDEYYPRPKQYAKIKDAEDKELLAEKRRLEYVTATRAGQALIFLDYIKGEPMFGGYEGSEYDLSNLPSVAPVILSTEPHKEPEKTGAKYDLAKENKACCDDRSSLNVDELIPSRQSISPSNFESGKSPTKNKAIAIALSQGRKAEDDMSESLPRPIGNIFGITMHRGLELIVGRYKAICTMGTAQASNDGGLSEIQKKAIVACAKQAVSESSNDIGEENIDLYFNFLKAVLVSYFAELKKQGWLDEGNVQVYTELPFSYYEDDCTEGMNQLHVANKHLAASKKLKDAPIWMNGSADLTLRKNAGQPDESVLIIDYKSDNDVFLNDREFHKSMSEKYIGQLDNYRYAVKKLWNVKDVTMKVVSFSQKDENGNVYEDDTVRVRISDIQESEE